MTGKKPSEPLGADEDLLVYVARIEGKRLRRRRRWVVALIWTMRLSSLVMAIIGARSIVHEPGVRASYDPSGAYSLLGLMAPLFIGLVIIWLPRFGRNYGESPLALVVPIFAWMVMLSVMFFLLVHEPPY